MHNVLRNDIFLWFFFSFFFLSSQYHLSMLDEVKIPIWLTEVDVLEEDPVRRANGLETVMRTAFSHPTVQGLILWSFWNRAAWRGPNTALVDGNDWKVARLITVPFGNSLQQSHNYQGLACYCVVLQPTIR